MSNPRSNDPRMNDEIKDDPIRLIDEEGEMIGVTPLADAVERARNAGMDLVEVSPDAKPPVCKILDYGKYKYQQQKRASDARKKQKVVSLKEVKLRPNIDSHDLEVKMRNVHKFLNAGDKVKFTLRFRGREMSHQKIGMDILRGIEAELGEAVRTELRPRLEGRQMIMIVAPFTV